MSRMFVTWCQDFIEAFLNIPGRIFCLEFDTKNNMDISFKYEEIFSNSQVIKLLTQSMSKARISDGIVITINKNNNYNQ